MLIAPMMSAGVVLSQPPCGVAAQQLFGFHGQQVAVQHGGGLLHRFAQTDRRHLHRKAPGLPNTALDLFHPLLEVGVTGVDVAPSVDDGNHRFARVVTAVVAHLRGARAVAKGAQVFHAVPAVAS
jgi:hypothetical protein